VGHNSEDVEREASCALRTAGADPSSGAMPVPTGIARIDYLIKLGGSLLRQPSDTLAAMFDTLAEAGRRKSLALTTGSLDMPMPLAQATVI
jgi:hypothetical protein